MNNRHKEFKFSISVNILRTQCRQFNWEFFLLVSFLVCINCTDYTLGYTKKSTQITVYGQQISKMDFS